MTGSEITSKGKSPSSHVVSHYSANTMKFDAEIKYYYEKHLYGNRSNKQEMKRGRERSLEKEQEKMQYHYDQVYITKCVARPQHRTFTDISVMSGHQVDLAAIIHHPIRAHEHIS